MPTMPMEGMHYDVTENEREVLALLGQGLSDSEVADRLGINEPAVRSRIARFREKTGLSGRQLTAWCARHEACCLNANSS